MFTHSEKRIHVAAHPPAVHANIRPHTHLKEGRAHNDKQEEGQNNGADSELLLLLGGCKAKENNALGDTSERRGNETHGKCRQEENIVNETGLVKQPRPSCAFAYKRAQCCHAAGRMSYDN